MPVDRYGREWTPQGRPVGWYEAQKAVEQRTGSGEKGSPGVGRLIILAILIAALIWQHTSRSKSKPDESDTPGLDRAAAGECIPINDTVLANHTSACTDNSYKILKRVKSAAGEDTDQARARCADVPDMRSFFNHSYAKPYYVLCLG